MAADYESIILADSPSLYYRFKDGGTTIADSSGNGYNGNYIGSPSTVAGFIPHDSASKALEIVDIVDKYGRLTAPATAVRANGAVTRSFEFIISVAAVEFVFPIITCRGGSGFHGEYAFYLLGRENYYLDLVFAYYPQSGGSGHVRFVSDYASQRMYPGRTYHIVVTITFGTTGSCYIYINNIAYNSPTIERDETEVPGYTTGVDNNLYIGKNPSMVTDYKSRFFGKIKISEVAVYGTALTATQVQQHYRAAVAMYALSGTVDVADFDIPNSTFFFLNPNFTQQRYQEAAADPFTFQLPYSVIDPDAFYAEMFMLIKENYIGYWQPSMNVTAGDLILTKSFSVAADVMECTQTGVTDTTEPVWPTEAGNPVTDNTAQFDFKKKALNPAILGPILLRRSYREYGDEWEASTTYALNDSVYIAAVGHWYKIESANNPTPPYTTGATEPAWPTDSSTVADNTVVWTDMGVPT